MTPEELDTLRGEATTFLRQIQELDGFGERLAELDPPSEALGLPFRSIRRLLSVPDGPGGEISPPPGTGLLKRDDDGELVELPKPSWNEIEALEAYERRVSIFARRFLTGPQWGARATHEALRQGGAILLPRAAPDVRIPLPDPTISGAELLRIAESHKPKSELRGDRSTTWMAAVAAIRTRLRGEAPTQRYAVGRAARYLDAAVNGRVGGRGETIAPLEPTDDPNYEERATARRSELERRIAEDAE